MLIFFSFILFLGLVTILSLTRRKNVLSISEKKIRRFSLWLAILIGTVLTTSQLPISIHTGVKGWVYNDTRLLSSSVLSIMNEDFPSLALFTLRLATFTAVYYLAGLWLALLCMDLRRHERHFIENTRRYIVFGVAGLCMGIMLTFLIQRAEPLIFYPLLEVLSPILEAISFLMSDTVAFALLFVVPILFFAVLGLIFARLTDRKLNSII
ncbi:MAG: hypothetical protein AAB855_01760 [Patescibacteria group bacterium]